MALTAGGRRDALRFVMAMGAVSLFADFTYEGARSITGPFLATLGASATIVGMVAGLGELVGYALRLVSGRITERTGWLWPLTIAGYAVQVMSVPVLALAPGWPAVAGLVVCERIGKAIRKPPRDVMLAGATAGIGRGLGFGLVEALDQIGAMAGPLLAAWVLARHGDHRAAFAWLLAPAMSTLALVLLARWLHPRAGSAPDSPRESPPAALPRSYWLMLAGGGLVAAGLADFALVSFHFTKRGVLAPHLIPIVYAAAMGASGLASLVAGRWYDRRGLIALIAITAATSMFAPLVFIGGAQAAVAGVILWGLALGAHESVLPAAVAALSPPRRLAWAYGVFHAGYGLSWFAGSLVLGALYDAGPGAAVVFSFTAQMAAIPCLLAAHIVHEHKGHAG